MSAEVGKIDFRPSPSSTTFPCSSAQFNPLSWLRFEDNDNECKTCELLAPNEANCITSVVKGDERSES